MYLPLYSFEMTYLSLVKDMDRFRGTGRPRGRPRKTNPDNVVPRKRPLDGDEDNDSFPHKRLKYTPDAVIMERTNNTARIHEDFTCKLCIDGEDGTEFYLMQIATFKDRCIFFARWGAEAKQGKWSAKREPSVKDAEKTFKKTFREKTENGWNTRHNFTQYPDKYYIKNLTGSLHDEGGDCDDEEKELKEDESSEADSDDHPLDDRTELMIKLILSREAFINQISVLKLNPKKLRPEKLSDRLMEQAEEALAAIEKAIKLRKPSQTMIELWMDFYNTVQHQDAEEINTIPTSVDAASSLLLRKQNTMAILENIKYSWNLLEQVGDDDLEPQELYHLLNCNLRLLDRDTEEFKLIEEFAGACHNSRPGVLLDVWRIHRIGDKSFDEFRSIDYRKLLWVGVNIGSVAAILKGGLRITPFTVGNLGRGVHLTPDHAGSSWNVGVHWGTYAGEKNVGFMFLAEAALGRIKYVKMGNSSLKQPPEGFNCVAAKGRLEPDSSKDQIRTFGGKRVIIPVGAPAPQKDFESSGFLRSEYVVYKEGQTRLRYLLKFSFDKSLAKSKNPKLHPK
ncbi:protein mono-ADP-ribosyltransferase PARP3-like isoform X1 [Macrobrachium nipponense]|uniref:protein mono-ADP-ribosyltransferase PARP3-like isoform X1 n=2 Tax=Macrobrachium nipponense TaxID=159736 RepID=UPI0030C88A3B